MPSTKKYQFMELSKSDVEVGKRYNIDGEYRYAARGDEGWPEESEICQYGNCERCNIKVMSWSKDSVCPKCGRYCYLT